MAEAPKETETELIRREMTPRGLVRVRWFVGVGIPTISAFRAGMRGIMVHKGWDAEWLDAIGDTTIAFGTALAGFMDRIWGRSQDEKHKTPPSG